MKFEVLASGSKANAYLFCDGTATIQLEAGLPVSKAVTMANWRLPDALLITHEHGDHARAVGNYLKRGVEVYMTAGTREALKLKTRYNLHELEPFKQVTICGHNFLPIPVKHDAAEPVCYLIDSEELFLTDAGEVPNITGKLRRVYIEANYSLMQLQASDIDELQRERVAENHLSIAQVNKFLRTLDELPEVVHLLHISKRHGDSADFVRRVKAAFGLEKVFAH